MRERGAFPFDSRLFVTVGHLDGGALLFLPKKKKKVSTMFGEAIKYPIFGTSNKQES